MDNKKISCKQVKSILPFYIKGTVNQFIADLVEEHLETCENCKKLYIKLLDEYNKSFLSDLEDIEIDISTPESKFDTEIYVTNEYQTFKKKLSAYFDSELDNKEQIRMKKLTISNPLARRDFEQMFRFKRLLHSSFEKTKSNFKKDFSVAIMKKISEKPVLNRNPAVIISLGIAFLTLAITFLLHYKG